MRLRHNFCRDAAWRSGRTLFFENISPRLWRQKQHIQTFLTCVSCRTHHLRPTRWRTSEISFCKDSDDAPRCKYIIFMSKRLVFLQLLFSKRFSSCVVSLAASRWGLFGCISFTSSALLEEARRVTRPLLVVPFASLPFF